MCAVLDRPSRWGFVGSFKALLLIPGALWIASMLSLSILFGIKGEALEPFQTVIGVLLFGAMCVFLVVAPRHQPVRLVAVDKQTLTFEIKNKQYFDEFKRLNVPASLNLNVE
jgi:hypothetical protein